MTKIRMLQTVEDMHKYVVTDDDGEPSVAYDTRVFAEGAEYDESSGGPDWERRAAGFLKLSNDAGALAEIVEA